jgi:hypothetical protein
MNNAVVVRRHRLTGVLKHDAEHLDATFVHAQHQIIAQRV